MAFEDFDNDSRPDLLLESQSQTGVQSLNLYLNAGDGSFRAVPFPFQIPPDWPQGCAAGDIDNDGRIDVAVAPFGGFNVHLFQNLGAGAFVEAATLSAPDPGNGSRSGFGAIGFADFDGDGLLDVIAAPYATPPSAMTCDQSSGGFSCFLPGTRCMPPPVVFRNTGAWTFAPPVSVVSASACGPANANAIAITDYDGDGRPDVFVANDWGVDALYVQSQTPLQFTDVAPTLVLKGYNNAMGAAFEDYDLDGTPDFYVSDVSSDQFYLGTGGGAVASHGTDWGVTAATMYHSGWAPLGDDFDSDGFTDVWVVNAAQVQDYTELSGAYGSASLARRVQSDFLFHNVGGRRFDAVLFPQTFSAQPRIIIGVSATADYDGDGQLDIVEAVGQPIRLKLLHNGVVGAHWINVRLAGHRSNRDGLGARVTLRQAGRPDVSKVVQRTRGSIGTSWAAVHFGLGSRTDVDAIIVRWPSGAVQTVSAPIADKLLLVDEP